MSAIGRVGYILGRNLGRNKAGHWDQHGVVQPSDFGLAKQDQAARRDQVMSKAMTLSEQAVEALISDILATFPDQLAAFYKAPPGRKPSEQSVKMREIQNALSESDAVLLVRDVVDRTLASALSLMDQNFKSEISTSFSTNGETERASGLLDAYRMQIDPGGNRRK